MKRRSSFATKTFIYRRSDIRRFVAMVTKYSPHFLFASFTRMESLTFLPFLIILFYANVVNSCPHDCTGNGLCNNGKCTCYAGFFKDDCSQNIRDTNPRAVIISQVIVGTLFLCLTILCSIAFYTALMKQHVTVPIIQNIRAIVFGSSLVISATQIVSSIDPLRVWGLLNTLVGFLLNCTFYPFTVLSFVAILFHWIDLVNLSLATLRRELMLQKISVREYIPKDITVEDMVEKLKFLGSLKLHFVIIVSFIFMFTYSVETVAALYPERRRLMRLMLFAVNCGSMIILSVGFLYYRRKLIKVMPQELTNKVKKLTARLTLLTLFLFVALVILFFSVIMVDRGSAAAYLGLWLVIEFCVAVLCFALPAVFFQWKSTFPYISFSSASGTVTTEGGTFQSSDSIEVAVVRSASDGVDASQLQGSGSSSSDVQVIEE